MKLILIFLIAVSTTAVAGSRPQICNKPIEIIVPYAPGGTASNLARQASEILSDNGILNVVVNKPGADGIIGANFAARATPDGCTLFLGTASIMVANTVFGATGAEYTDKDFVPIITMAKTGSVLITSSNSPFTNFEQFKFYIRANPEKFNIGTWNTNLAKVWIRWAEQENLPKPTVIPYKGTAPMLTDIAGGNLLLGIDIWTSSIPLYRAGKIDVIATLDSKIQANVQKVRLTEYKHDVFKNHPDLNLSTWYGIFAPRNTPLAVVNRLNLIINTGLKESKNIKNLQSMDITEYGGTPQSLEKLQNNEMEILQKIKSNQNVSL